MTLFEVYKQSIKELNNPDVEEINIRILLCEINNLKSMSDFYLQKDKEIRDLPRYQEYFARYLKGEPVQYILGKTEFLGNEILVDKRVLIPRQESEEVVDFAIRKTHEVFGSKTIDLADVCCGSGVMGISLSKKLNVGKVWFSDISKKAIDVAKLNCEHNKIKGNFICGDSLDKLIINKVKVDLLISNPPYILREENIDNSVLDYEPHLALFADETFSIYRNIISNLENIKNNTLLAVFEIGNNTRKVLEPFIKEKYPNAEYAFLKDMNKKERILYIVLK